MMQDFSGFWIHYGVLVGALSLLFLLISLVATFFVVAALPSDYWIKQGLQENNGSRNFFISFARNTIALLLAAVGFVLLFTPGQGLLTIIVAVIVSDFSKKHHWIRRLVKHIKVRRSLNSIRSWFGKSHFTFE